MNTKTTRIQEIQTAQGWTDETLFNFAIEYMNEDNRGLTYFERWLEEKANEENNQVLNVFAIRIYGDYCDGRINADNQKLLNEARESASMKIGFSSMVSQRALMD